ncbi:MAG: ABC transporter ATP-binding protein [Christensenellales bacterium]
MALIDLQNVTKAHPDGGGLFDCTIQVEQGASFGLLGPKGAGKSTAVALLMGFIRPDVGTCQIGGRDCFRERQDIQARVGYVPRHPALPPRMTGEQFIRMKSALAGTRSPRKEQELMERLAINPLGPCGRMSDAMQQKLSLLGALMGAPDVLILDEPTLSLDELSYHPLQEVLAEEKKKGTTIFITSHVLRDVQRMCDVIGIIRKGRLAVVQPARALEYTRQKVYHITFATNQEASDFAQEWQTAVEVLQNRATVAIPGSPQVLVRTLAKYMVVDLIGGRQESEESYLRYYGDDTA